LCIILPNFIAIDHAVAKIWHAPSWIFKSSKFGGPVDWRGSVCITMPNFVAVGQAISKMWQFHLFQDGGCLESWILKVGNFNG